MNSPLWQNRSKLVDVSSELRPTDCSMNLESLILRIHNPWDSPALYRVVKVQMAGNFRLTVAVLIDGLSQSFDHAARPLTFFSISASARPFF